LEITDNNFSEEVENYKGIALVDFWAPWCGPCKMMEPVIEELAEDLKDKTKVAKLNVDKNPETAQKFGVMSIPTTIIYKSGKEVERLIGVQSKEDLISKIEDNI
ncbi:MAG: thioredoxin, partial [Candidatus Heimdallarchaeota archaeon]